MSLTDRNIHTIGERELQSLIDGGVREQRDIDYKKMTYGNSEGDRAEFLADISSFANASGGDIVIGIDEQQGIPTSLTGIGPGIDADKEVLRLEQIARSGISPRIPGLTVRAVELPSINSTAIVVRIPKSYRPPHRVVLGGRNKFLARSSGGKYELDVDELRAVFVQAPNLGQRIRDICLDRLAQIRIGETPLPLQSAPGTLVVHIVPFSAADIGAPGLSVERLLTRTTERPWLPWGCDATWFRRNFDGVVFFPEKSEGLTPRSYLQVFRSGFVECVAAGIATIEQDQGRIDIQRLERGLLQQIEAVVGGLRSNEIGSPCAVLVTLINVRGFLLTSSEPIVPGVWFGDPPLPIERDMVTFIDTVVPEGNPTQHELRTALQPLLEQLYHAGALPVQGRF